MSDKNEVFASGEYVIIQSVAHPAGSEILSPSGFLLGIREHGEMPISGVVVSVGSEVPEEVRDTLLGSTVALPSAHLANVPHPGLISGKLTAEEAKKDINKLSSCHYKAIQVVYGK